MSLLLAIVGNCGGESDGTDFKPEPVLTSTTCSFAAIHLRSIACLNPTNVVALSGHANIPSDPASSSTAANASRADTASAPPPCLRMISSTPRPPGGFGDLSPPGGM